MNRSFPARLARLCLLLPLAVAGCREDEAQKAEQAALEKKIATVEDQFGRMETMVKVERSRASQLEQALKQAQADLEQSRAEAEKLRQAPAEAEAAKAAATAAAAEEPRITGRTLPSVVYKGETYKKVKIHYIHNGEVKVSHSGGVGRWKIDLFPPDMQPVLLAENQTGDISENALANPSFAPASAPVTRPALPPALPPVPPVRRPGTSAPPPATAGARLEDEIVPSVPTAEPETEPVRTRPPPPALPPEPDDEPDTPSAKPAPAPAGKRGAAPSSSSNPTRLTPPPAEKSGGNSAPVPASTPTPTPTTGASAPRNRQPGTIIEAPPPQIGKLDEVPAVASPPIAPTPSTPVVPPPGGENSGLLLPPPSAR